MRLMIASFSAATVAGLAAEARAQAIRACANDTNGNLRIVAKASECRNHETFLTWNQGAGTPGPRGPTGPQGPAGPAGGTVTLVQLPPGDAHCPTGGVKIEAAGTCRGRGEHHDSDARRDDDHHEDHDSGRCTPPSLAFVCNGPTGPAGDPGTGGRGAAYTDTEAPSHVLPPGVPVVVAHVDVPAGQYVVKAKGECSSAIEAGTGQIQCRLVATSGTADVDSQRTVTISGRFTTTTLLGPLSTPSAPAGIDLICQTNDPFPGAIDNAQLAAMQVSTLVSTIAPIPFLRTNR
jgi:hypothetical protein